MVKNRIKFGEDQISIFDNKGEVVMWTEQEWVEDPSIVFSITNAVKMAVEGKDLRKKLAVKLRKVV